MTQLMTEQGMVRVPAGTWDVDPAHSSAAYEVKHVGEKVSILLDVSAVRAA
jgi:polyisoprenoid-binding protein YceI